jgi:hypothetical protein
MQKRVNPQAVVAVANLAAAVLAPSSPSLEAARAYLDNLDLSYIIDQICDDSYPLPRWSPADAKTCADLYKRFLWLMVKHGAKGLVPTKEIDEFWHNHILHTKQYIADCKALVGHYIHHQPSDRTKEEDAALAQAFAQTQALCSEEFGEPFPFYHHEDSPET